MICCLRVFKGKTVAFSRQKVAGKVQEREGKEVAKKWFVFRRSAQKSRSLKFRKQYAAARIELLKPVKTGTDRERQKCKLYFTGRVSDGFSA